MTLKELQKMIKEEFDSYMGEAEDDVDVSVNPDSDVDAEMGDMEDEGSEEMLRKIYDMLKDKFEAEEEDMGDDMDKDMDEDMDENMPMEEDMDEGDSDLDEASSMGYGDAGNKKTSGKDAGYTPAKTTKGDGKLHESVLRFQKLANIIK